MGRSDDCVSAFKSERSAFRLFQQIDQSRRRCTLRNLNPNLAILPGPLIESNDQRVAVFGLLHRQRTGKRKSKGNSVSSFFLTVTIIASATLTPAQRIGVTYSADAQTSAALKNLSPDAQKVMERLSHLGSVPVEAITTSATLSI